MRKAVLFFMSQNTLFNIVNSLFGTIDPVSLLDLMGNISAIHNLQEDN
jgi:hypothetical protein